MRISRVCNLKRDDFGNLSLKYKSPIGDSKNRVITNENCEKVVEGLESIKTRLDKFYTTSLIAVISKGFQLRKVNKYIATIQSEMDLEEKVLIK